MIIKIKNIIALSLLLLSFQGLKAQFYNGSHLHFGKNRVQYNDANWKFYKFPEYEVYFNEGEEDLAVYVAKYAQKYIDEYQKYFNYRLDRRIKFLVFKTQSDYRRSNIGIGDDETYNIGGVTQIYGKKAFVYFNGNHADLQKQIKADIIQVILYQMVYGTSWREVLKNSALLTLPDWYTKGLVSYLSNPWDPDIANQIKDGVSTGRLSKFNRLDQEQSVIAGHALWYYIGQTYGRPIIPNIIAITSVSRSIESGFSYVLGTNLKGLIKASTAFYEKKFAIKEEQDKKQNTLKAIKGRIKRNTHYYNIRTSPSGNKIAYVTNKMGRYHIYINDISTGEKTKVFTKGHQLNQVPDYNFPQIAWHPSGEILTFTDEKKGKLLLHLYNLKSKKITTQHILYLDKILSMQYDSTGMNMVLSAINNKQSDIYQYNIAANSLNRLTNDKYDDLHPYFLPKEQKIVFSSNRPNSNIKTEDYKDSLFDTHTDIFVYNLKTKKLNQLTQTKDINETKPTAGDSLIYYLAPYKGAVNRFSAKHDSAISFIDTTIHYRYFYDTEPRTSYDRNIESYDINEHSNKITQIMYKDNKYRIYTDKLLNKRLTQNKNFITDSSLKNTLQHQFLTDSLSAYPIKKDNLTSQSEIDYHHYKFEAEKQSTKENNQTVDLSTEKNKKSKDTIDNSFHLSNMNNYQLSFYTDNTTTQINNEFLNRTYQSFNGGPYISPGIGIALKLGVSDIMEDYKIYGGARFGNSTREFFIAYENLKRLVDKKISVTRSVLKQNLGALNYSTFSHTAKYNLKLPFSAVSSLSGTASIRYDHLIVKSSDVQTLQYPNQNDYLGGLGLSYTFDNTRYKSLNIKYGTRFKAFGQYLQEFSDPQYNTMILGLDYRHYQKISRNLIWVSRFAGGTSFGKQKMVYYLGSVDDWIILGKKQRFNNKTVIDLSQNYRFQALAAPMRGFNQNIRNGSNFAVLNNEIRWPFVKYFSVRPIQSAFFRYLQVIGFGDIGTAWTGLSPYGKDNLINKKVIGDYPVRVTLYDNTNPIVGGFGFGLRTMMLGYFVRADYAWGVLDGVIQKPIFYLSLSLDI